MLTDLLSKIYLETVIGVNENIRKYYLRERIMIRLLARTEFNKSKPPIC